MKILVKKVKTSVEKLVFLLPMKKRELARLFYREAEKIHQNTSWGTTSKVEGLYRLLNLIFVEITSDEQIQFTTLFARIAYVSQQYDLEKQTHFFIHLFRKKAKTIADSGESENAEQVYSLGLKVVLESIAALYGEPIPPQLETLLPNEAFLTLKPVEISGFKSKVRAVILKDDVKNQQFIGYDENNPANEIFIQYNLTERNENFNPSIKAIREKFSFPLNINLIDVEIDLEGHYRPAAFVIEPDYLVDVSAISECFKDSVAEPLFYLLKKYLPFEYTKHLMIGNIANFFLDELMSNPEVTFKEIFPKVFRLNPLAFVLFENSEVREIMQTSQKHFVNLQRMVLKDFAENGIVPADCVIEPSFYSEWFGLQGRLDVFYRNPENEKSAIIELKSGSPFKPNVYGISSNHFIQTLLYDLIIKSVYNGKLDPSNYILYSGTDDNNLRYAPRVKAQQYEALQLRNQLIAIEQDLIHLKSQEGKATIFEKLKEANFGKLKGFALTDIQAFEKVYQGMSPLDREYFIAFSAFIAREHQLAKTGVQGLENVNGLAKLWLNDDKEKEEQFDIISHLKVHEHQIHSDDPAIVFKKTKLTNPLANFRKGDIAVLYPFQSKGGAVLSNQIFKCSITAITNDLVEVRLRSKQFNNSIFERDIAWNLEHDMMDNSFIAMYRSLFQFVQFDDRKKRLLYTLEPPQQPEEQSIKVKKELTEEQGDILLKMINARDYFLLWGPPGTGKTSMMLRHFVSHLLNETDENLLLLAYTNRAVDEICDAIEKIDPLIKKEYIRIGSRFSTQEQFHEQLLDQKISQIDNRKDLKETIENHRIYVATIASLAGKMDLLKLKKFDRVIIDEASQILEPMLVGLLPHFDRFVLIGDHKQLPAVVVQSPEESKIESEKLNSIGLVNMRDSLFERMYKRCIENEWNWAFARLSHQGRMHHDIMDFPNEHFYNSGLKILPEQVIAGKFQTQNIEFQKPSNISYLEQLLCSRRKIFLPTETDNNSSTGKTNAFEANLISELVFSFQRIYEFNKRPFNKNSIGIITPYRAQIAQIRKALSEKSIDPELLTIDTVERYQGGARDVILISLCLNNPTQLKSLISQSEDGVDRKLNVALTRAREHLIVLGNVAILRQNAIYDQLMKSFSAEVSVGE